jgi:hypothetical protein
MNIPTSDNALFSLFNIFSVKKKNWGKKYWEASETEIHV